MQGARAVGDVKMSYCMVEMMEDEESCLVMYTNGCESQSISSVKYFALVTGNRDAFLPVSRHADVAPDRFRNTAIF
jgi:hypothetical protein